MKINKKIKLKKYSLIELSFVIVLIPLVILLTSSMFMHLKRTCNAIIHNTTLYSNMQKASDIISADGLNSTGFSQEDNKFYFLTNEGIIVYEYKEDVSSLYRNEHFLVKIKDFSLQDITEDEHLYPLYEINMTGQTKGLKQNYTDLNLKLNFTVNLKRK